MTADRRNKILVLLFYAGLPNDLLFSMLIYAFILILSSGSTQVTTPLLLP